MIPKARLYDLIIAARAEGIGPKRLARRVGLSVGYIGSITRDLKLPPLPHSNTVIVPSRSVHQMILDMREVVRCNAVQARRVRAKASGIPKKAPSD